MLAGDGTKRTGGNDFESQAISYVCLNYSSTSPYYNKLPDQPCPDGLRAQIFFPSCWDGVNLDSEDHKSHMAYPTMYSYNNGPCPASHPVHLVSIFFEIIYSTIQFDWWVPDGGWQPFVFSNGDPTGYGFHGDFVNGWDVPTLQRAIDNCTADSGTLEDCPVIANDLYTNDEASSCILAPKINEQIYGVMDKLPGCNPVRYNSSAPSGTCDDTAVVGDAATYYKNVTGWQYLGCGKDNGVNRTFTADHWWSNSVTIEGCMDYCKSRGHSYAGLEYSTQCFCGDSLPSNRAPTPGVLGNCLSPCAGNSSDYCGGSNRLSIYYNPGSYSPVSSSGASAVPKLPICPNSNGTMYNTTNSATFQVQCGTDRSGGDIGMQYVPGGNITACMELCSKTNSCSYVALSGGACYMKSGSNLRAVSNGAVYGAQLMVTGAAASSSASSTASSASSTASPSPSATLCPDSDGQVINGYTVRCTSDSSVGSYTSAQASSSYLDCMTACDGAASSNCLGFVYVGGTNGRGSGTCWLKTAMGTIVTARGPNYIAAFKPKPSAPTSSSSASASTIARGSASSSASASSTSTPATSAASSAPVAGATYTTAPTCPSYNSTYYSSTNGSTFLIECGIDHAGGDMGSLSVRSFQQCIEVCASTNGCVDVSLSGVACYLKASVGAINYNGVLGAKLVSGPSVNSNAVVANARFRMMAAATTKTSSTKKLTTSTKKVVKKTKAKTKTSNVAKNLKKGGKKTNKVKKVTKKTKKVKTTKSVAKPVRRTSKAVSASVPARVSIESPSAITSPSKTAQITTKQTSTKTTASPSSTVTSIDCPYSNQTYFIDPKSKYEFFLECGVDRQGSELFNTTAKSLTACISLCAKTEDCEDISYDKAEKQCYLKAKAEDEAEFVSTINGARLHSKPTTTTTTTTTVPAETNTAEVSSVAASTTEAASPSDAPEADDTDDDASPTSEEPAAETDA